MSLTRVNYEDIDWRDGREGREERLYRGNSQGHFEYNVFESLTAEGKPSYYGCLDSSGRRTDNENRITFCDPIYIIALHFFEDWTDKLRERPGYSYYSYSEPFSRFPLFMEIDARNYRDRIYKSTEGEGLVIRGPISTDDITILFSTHINRLAESWPKNLDMGGLLEYLEDRCKALSRKDLLVKADENKRRVIEMLQGAITHSQRLVAIKGDEFDKYFDVLRGKLRA